MAAMIVEQRVPDAALAMHEEMLAAESGDESEVAATYVVSLGICHAFSAQARAKVTGFYVAGMGCRKTHDVAESDGSKKRRVVQQHVLSLGNV